MLRKLLVRSVHRGLGLSGHPCLFERLLRGGNLLPGRLLHGIGELLKLLACRLVAEAHLVTARAIRRFRSLSGVLRDGLLLASGIRELRVLLLQLLPGLLLRLAVLWNGGLPLWICCHRLCLCGSLLRESLGLLRGGRGLLRLLRGLRRLLIRVIVRRLLFPALLRLLGSG